MTKSEDIKELAAALSKFHGKTPIIETDSTNPYYESDFASHDAVMRPVRPVLAECELAYMQNLINLNLTPGEARFYIRGTLIHAPSGQFVESDWPVITSDMTPQSFGSSVSYAKRYQALAMLNLTVNQDDDDAEKAMNRQPTVRQQAEKSNYERTLRQAKPSQEYRVKIPGPFFNKTFAEIPTNTLNNMWIELAAKNPKTAQEKELLDAAKIYMKKNGAKEEDLVV